jgi:hypothetical protein
MLSRVALSVVVGVVTWIVALLVGWVLVEVSLESIGAFVKGVAPLLGLVAGVWYFFTGETPGRAV